MPKTQEPSSAQRRAAARNLISRLLQEAGWPIGKLDGEHAIVADRASVEEPDVDIYVTVEFGVSDLGIEQELARMLAEKPANKPAPPKSTSARSAVCTLCGNTREWHKARQPRHRFQEQ